MGVDWFPRGIQSPLVMKGAGEAKKNAKDADFYAFYENSAESL
jgi:hypothetical protein